MKYGAYHYVTKSVRLRRAAIAGPQCLRAPGSEPPGGDAERAGRRAESASSCRPEPPDPRDRRPGAQGREAVGHGADPGRERHRQGAAGAAAPPRVRPARRAVHRRQPVGDPARAGGEHAVRPRARLVHRRAQAAARASSSWPPAARCSSTRSATSGSTSRPSCCGPSRKGKSSGSAAPSRSAPTSGWWWRPTSTSRRRPRRGASARISTTGSTSSRSGCRRSASGSTTCRSWRGSSSSATGSSSASRCAASPDSALKILASYRWPGQHPRAREPHRAAGRGQRQGVDHRRGPPARVSLRQAGFGPGGRRDAVPGGVRHVRAQLHPAGAREVRLERDGDRPLSRDPAQHAEAQDGPPRTARPRAQAARRLSVTNPPSVPSPVTASTLRFAGGGQYSANPANRAANPLAGSVGRRRSRAGAPDRPVERVQRVHSERSIFGASRSRRLDMTLWSVAADRRNIGCTSTGRRRRRRLVRSSAPRSAGTKESHAALDVQRPCPARWCATTCS